MQNDKSHESVATRVSKDDGPDRCRALEHRDNWRSVFRGKAYSAEEEKRTSESGKIKIAGYEYDRVEGLIDGRVKVDGCDVQFEVSSIGKMNTHVFSGPKTREITEIGLSPYMLAFANEGFRDYTLIPVFPLRLFRHKSIFIRTDRGIRRPKDLRGRKIATPGYSSSGLTWIRGILQDEYGVRPDEIQWVVTGKDSAAKLTGGASKWERVLPANLSITQAPEGKDESDLLIAGDVDAIFHPAEPQVYADRHPRASGDPVKVGQEQPTCGCLCSCQLYLSNADVFCCYECWYINN